MADECDKHSQFVILFEQPMTKTPETNNDEKVEFVFHRSSANTSLSISSCSTFFLDAHEDSSFCSTATDASMTDVSWYSSSTSLVSDNNNNDGNAIFQTDHVSTVGGKTERGNNKMGDGTSKSTGSTEVNVVSDADKENIKDYDSKRANTSHETTQAVLLSKVMRQRSSSILRIFNPSNEDKQNNNKEEGYMDLNALNRQVQKTFSSRQLKEIHNEPYNSVPNINAERVPLWQFAAEPH